jgi:hypothetical protein
MPAEILTTDPLVSVWKYGRLMRPDPCVMSAVIASNIRDVDAHSKFIAAATDYVWAIMMTMPKAGDTIH